MIKSFCILISPFLFGLALASEIRVIESERRDAVVVQLIDENQQVLDSLKSIGRSGSYKSIEGPWKSGPIHLLTTVRDQNHGSLEGEFTMPFEVKNNRLSWSRVSRGPGAGSQIVWINSGQQGWKLEIKTLPRSQKRILVHEAVSSPFRSETTYTEYLFTGEAWETKAHTSFKAWKKGDPL